MNSFFNSIVNILRNIRASVTTFFQPRQFVFGSIISGKYSNFKTDPSPTILYMGTYQNVNNHKFYIHGINLHYLNSFDLQWLIKLLYIMKRAGQQVNPRSFYYYIKINRPDIVKRAYRIYHAEMANYYTVSPGCSNLPTSACYSITDARDSMIAQLNAQINAVYNANQTPVQIAYDKNELQQHITEVLNTRRIT